ncbi:hypothetical protein N9164_03680 [Draconibacterium sp.]|nr:hypothetical protein [Draconibacterium sp.]
MNKVQNFGKLLMLFVIITGVISCDKNEANITFEVIGDVFISKRLINDEEHFAHVYYAYGNQRISSATVTPQGGEEIELSPLDANEYTYGIQPTPEDFSTEFPGIGTFDFKVVNEGIEHSTSDMLLFDNLEIPHIDTVEFNSVSQTVMVEWETVSGAQSYIIKLTKDNGDIIFIGQLLNDLATVYEIDSNLGSWFEVPQYGITYNVEVHAFLYDADADYSDYMYHIQENSIGNMKVTWGE